MVRRNALRASEPFRFQGLIPFSSPDPGFGPAYTFLPSPAAVQPGKTHLGCAFANEAILRGIPVKFYKFQNLLTELIAADQENQLAKFRKRLSRFKLLIIDDWGISMLSSAQRHMLYDLVESRDKQCSMLITSQYPVSDWYDAFGDETIAESVLDRIVHASHKLNLTGVSMRKVNGVEGGNHED